MEYFPKIADIKKAALTIRQVTEVTPLMHSIRLSKYYDADIFLKREDLHRVYVQVRETMPKVWLLLVITLE